MTKIPKHEGMTKSEARMSPVGVGDHFARSHPSLSLQTPEPARRDFVIGTSDFLGIWVFRHSSFSRHVM